MTFDEWWETYKWNYAEEIKEHCKRAFNVATKQNLDERRKVVGVFEKVLGIIRYHVLVKHGDTLPDHIERKIKKLSEEIK